MFENPSISAKVIGKTIEVPFDSQRSTKQKYRRIKLNVDNYTMVLGLN